MESSYENFLINQLDSNIDSKLNYTQIESHSIVLLKVQEEMALHPMVSIQL